MIRAILMGQGQNTRWKSSNGDTKDLFKFGSDCKHMIPMGKYGPPNIARTGIMLTLHGCLERIIIAKLGQAGTLTPTGVFTLDDPGTYLLDGIRQTKPLWSEGRTLIILADVIFSHDLIDRMVHDQAPVRFYGRREPNSATGKEAAELFACAFNAGYADQIYDHCVWMIKRGSPIKYPPKLWALYRLMAGFEHDEYQYEDEVFYNSTDYTDDIDSFDEAKLWYDIMNTEAAKDDDTCWCDPRRRELFP